MVDSVLAHRCTAEVTIHHSLQRGVWMGAQNEGALRKMDALSDAKSVD